MKVLQHALTMLLQMALFKANRNLSQCRGGGWVEITVQCCLVYEALGLIPSQIPHPTPSQKKNRQPATFVFNALPKFLLFCPYRPDPYPPPHTHKNLMVLAISATFL